MPKDICPQCGKTHNAYPRNCELRVQSHHAIVCGITTTHEPSCIRDAMKAYIAKNFLRPVLA